MAAKTNPPKALFDIAAAQREVDDEEKDLPPFTVSLPQAGRVITLKSIAQCDWADVARLSDETPMLLMQTIVEEEDQEDLFKERFSLGVLRKLLLAWREHYGIEPDSGNSVG